MVVRAEAASSSSLKHRYIFVFICFGGVLCLLLNHVLPMTEKLELDLVQQIMRLPTKSSSRPARPAGANATVSGVTTPGRGGESQDKS